MSFNYYLTNKLESTTMKSFELGGSKYSPSQIFFMYFDRSSIKADLLLHYKNGKSVLFSKLKDPELRHIILSEYTFEEPYIESRPDIIRIDRVVYSKLNKKLLATVIKLYYYLDSVFYAYDNEIAIEIRHALTRIAKAMKSNSMIIAFDYSAELFDDDIEEYMLRGTTFTLANTSASFGARLLSHYSGNFKKKLKSDILEIAGIDESSIAFNRIASDTNLRKVAKNVNKVYSESELIDESDASNIIKYYSYYLLFEESGTSIADISKMHDFGKHAPVDDFDYDNAWAGHNVFHEGSIALSFVTDALALISEASAPKLPSKYSKTPSFEVSSNVITVDNIYKQHSDNAKFSVYPMITFRNMSISDVKKAYPSVIAEFEYIDNHISGILGKMTSNKKLIASLPILRNLIISHTGTNKLNIDIDYNNSDDQYDAEASFNITIGNHKISNTKFDATYYNGTSALKYPD